MAMIRKGEIKVPYNRTHAYSKGYRITKIDNGWVLTNATPWARWVAGTGEGSGGYQARVHEGRWAALDPTLRETLSRIDIRILARLRLTIEEIMKE